MQFSTTSMGTHQVRTNQEQVISVYERAFGRPPYEKSSAEVTEFASSVGRNTLREGFRFVAGFDSASGSMAGFAFGYTLTSDQWWYQVVAQALLPETKSAWLTDCFKFAEIAVTPEHQGKGLGGKLHDHLLEGIEVPRAVLSTLLAESAAYYLYLGRGWNVILEKIDFPGVLKSYRIMGLQSASKNPTYPHEGNIS